MDGLGLCIIITLLGMWYIPASPTDAVGFTKMVIAIIFIVIAWAWMLIGKPLTG